MERPYDETGIYHGHEGVLAHSGIEETFGWVRCFLRVPSKSILSNGESCLRNLEL